jgi:hypothetical protein
MPTGRRRRRPVALGPGLLAATTEEVTASGAWPAEEQAVGVPPPAGGGGGDWGGARPKEEVAGPAGHDRGELEETAGRPAAPALASTAAGCAALCGG